MNILLLSAYDAASHKIWREGLVRSLPDFNFTQLTLPPRYFSWRIRGNALSFAHTLKTMPTLDFDLVLATSMVDLSTLVGIVPGLSAIPRIVYFHENQFAFPTSDRVRVSLEPQMVNLFSAMSATSVCFNSQHNLDSFLSGVSSMLEHFPDAVPPDVVSGIEQKSRVLPVPLPCDVFNVGNVGASRRGSIVWNHRWEYDKGPDRLLALIEALPKDLELTFHIIGQKFNRVPKEMSLINACLEERGWLGTWGSIESREAYLACLATSEYVLSTSIHDFQGLSMLEAMSLGCLPIAPNRLAYREYIDCQCLYDSYEDAIDKEACSAANLLVQFISRSASTRPTIHFEPGAYSWSRLMPEYRALIESVFDEQ